MKRLMIPQRSDWQSRVESHGLIWHTVDNKPYWHEGVYYSFSLQQIEEIEEATNSLYNCFLEAGQAILDDPEGLSVFGIPDWCHKAIREAWNTEPPALNYGRFDFGYDGKSPPKLFEFNCDTPTSLLEAAVAQWYWKEDCFPKLDQFNSIHEKLIGKWKDIRSFLPDQKLWFTSVADEAGEDLITTSYLRDTAADAGLKTETILIDDIGWHNQLKVFVDLNNTPITAIYHLYPWEWLVNESFGRNLIESLDQTVWIEPIWKMIWSNKAILPVLAKMFPDHPNLLGASYREPSFGRFVKKPFLGREGANIALYENGSFTEMTHGDYGEEGFVYQERFSLPEMDKDTYPVIGSWVIDGQAAGMGIREDGLITGNTARFVPHVIEG